MTTDASLCPFKVYMTSLTSLPEEASTPQVLTNNIHDTIARVLFQTHCASEFEAHATFKLGCLEVCETKFFKDEAP